MSSRQRKNASATRGRPFERGNAGRPKGSRNKTTLAMEVLLDGEAEALARRAVEMALAGDTVALRLCLDRLLPVRKDRPISLPLPKLETTADAMKAASFLVDAVATGELTPSEASEVGKVVEGFFNAAKMDELHKRLEAIEAAVESRS